MCREEQDSKYIYICIIHIIYIISLYIYYLYITTHPHIVRRSSRLLPALRYAMEDLQVQWSQVAWSQLPAMVASYPSNLREMHPLLEMLGEILVLWDI